MPAPIAVVRDVPTSFSDATVLEASRVPLDSRLAAVQHAAVVDQLAELGSRVERIAADDRHPDCCFVEDAAVVVGELGVVARSGNPSRHGEVGPVAARLEALGVSMQELPSGATLDGGDVLVVDRTVFVGLSTRTNRRAAAALERCFQPLGYRVETVDVPRGTLHLKCLCSSPAPGLVVVAEGPLVARLAGLRQVVVPKDEALASNVVGRGGRVLVSSGFPRTTHALEVAGLSPSLVDTSELRRADGALTCLSIRLHW